MCSAVILSVSQGVLCRTLQGHAHWVSTVYTLNMNTAKPS